MAVKRKILCATVVFVSLVALSLGIASCHKEDEPKPLFAASPYSLIIPQFFPSILNLPSDNPLTVEGVELGRYLFYDTRLCGYTGSCPDSMMSCASCHQQACGFDVGLENPRFLEGATCGLSGKPTPHSPMPLVNLVFNKEGYFWNGAIYAENPTKTRRNLEDVVLMGITAPHEMNSTAARAVAAIQSAEIYPPMFKAAFGTSEVTIERIQKAVAQFIRTLVSGNSKFDAYLRGEIQLSPQELRGYVLFTTEEGADCFHCHGGAGTPLFTTNLFYNNALDSQFSDDRDRYAVTGNEKDRGAYRAPTLRNIAVTPPYMHDGRFKTLDEVLQFYNSELVNSPYVHPLMHKVADGGAWLTPSQMADLKSFLLTLTDEDFLTEEKFSNPFEPKR
ncbi:MAG: c-type cytochrome [Bacteroidales bacterium]|nr:c-type cytochrome [Bacteroidales bacterium]